MTKLYVVSSFKIHADKLDDFKACAQEALDIVREKDPATTHYEWFFNDDQTQCTVLEGYEDSQAAMAHLGSIGATLGKVLQTATFSARVLGEVSPELKAALAGLDLEFHSHYAHSLA